MTRLPSAVLSCRGLLASVVVLALGACDAYNEQLLPPPDEQPNVRQDGGAAGASGEGGSDAGPVAGDGGAGTGGTGGTGGTSGTGGEGGAGDCMPNPDATDEVCPLICPETCNGKDDDCDLKVDEDEASTSCTLPNAAQSFCDKGACFVQQCEPGFQDCDGAPETGCEVPPDDIGNCGFCGTKCVYGNAVAECIAGLCRRGDCNPGFGDCDDNPNDCETELVTNDNCGRCGGVCVNVPNATPSCDTGVCGPAECTGAYGDCNLLPEDGCEIDLTQLTHCGGCNQSCDFAGSSDECVDGTCFAQAGGCEAGYDDCDGQRDNGCEPLDTADDCGACGEVCDTRLLNSAQGTQCAAGACTLLCEPGYGDCDGDLQTGCETKLDSLSHCGQCNTACARANAVATCAGGGCAIAACASAAYGDCNTLDGDGCETDLTLAATCGGCSNDCASAAGKPYCSGGQCTAINCTDPMADCNGDGASCETNLSNNASNCGSCGNACAFNAGSTPHATLNGCVSKQCQITCDAGYGDCNGDYKDGCEVQLNTLVNCDACGVACAIPNAAAKCTTFTAGHYQCEIATCGADFGDCDGDLVTCETPLDTPAHCNTCGNVCNLPNAVEACTGASGSRSCAISACDQNNFKNCNGTVADGCEIDTNTSAGNCGACGNNCASHANVASATCSGGVCGYTCSAGFKDCDVTPGCETNAQTLQNCGSCGTTCSRANATASCSTGTCQIQTCNADHDNCDGNDQNGCEPLTTLTDCGSCTAPLCGFPNATASCSTKTCQLVSCNQDWDNCDGNTSNGCERDVRPPASGGLGPCVPDSGCTKQMYGGREYYFCTTLRSWSAARARCRLQLSGDLVRIDDAGENTFVRTNANIAGGNVWIGASDATTEGNWRWVDTDTQFWQGTYTGSAVGGLYTNWTTGSEPNDYQGKQDCGVMWNVGTTGNWDDEDCTAALRFVCEVAGDLCPSDPAKTNPLQCGCGTPDVHSDGDGIADCNETCDTDPNKLAPGLCGCGVADTNADGDSEPDCTDECDNDANKVVAGQCGCGVADADFDLDGAMDCNDGCPYDKNHTAAGTCAYDYTPSNFTPGQVNLAGAPNVNVNCNATLSSSTTTAVTVCGTSITPVILTQSGGPELWVLPMQSLTVAAGSTLKITGSRPAVLAVAGNATVNGTIDVGSVGATAGAGGDVSCAAGTGQGTDGVHDGDSNDGDGGGGGGGFGNAGAAGGNGNDGASGQAAGAANGSATLVPLRGGCRGGSGGAGGNVNGAGAGGGAIQLAVGGKLTLAATAVIAAPGGGGNKGGAHEDSGGGGGSGGAILLEAYVLAIDANAWITANGGGGAGGNATNNANGTAGTDGLKTATTQAPGGSGGDGGGGLSGNASDGGGGGKGAALGGNATAGGNASSRSCFLLLCNDPGGGGGGGGGGVGRIRVHGVQAGCSVPTTRVSPAASVACP